MKKILFPISLGNDRFSTENAINGISSITENYNEIVCIIADQIQLYNRVMSVHDADDLLILIKKFRSGKNLFEERSIWLDKIKSNRLFATNKSIKWTVFGFEDITDHTFNKIFRNVLIMYNSIIEFQEDVNADARNFVLKRNQKKSFSESDFNLSVYYILEEIAASVRLHVCENIYSEYYLGRHLKCIIRLYSTYYGIDVFTIAGEGFKEINWKFYDFNFSDNIWSENRILEQTSALVIQD